MNTKHTTRGPLPASPRRNENMSRSTLEIHSSKSARLTYCALGLLATSLGIVGAFLPVMPTTCFLLLALWAFSKSSPSLHRWLWEHPRLGRSLRRWQEHRCIPIEAKLAATLSMAGSMTYVLLFSGLGPLPLSAMGAFIALGAYFVLRAPSHPPRPPEHDVVPETARALNLALPPTQALSQPTDVATETFR